MREITFDFSDPKRITCDTTKAPFDGEPILIKLAKGWCEAWWDKPTGPDPNGEYDGFCWRCLDDDFQAEWNEPSYWAPLPAKGLLTEF